MGDEKILFLLLLFAHLLFIFMCFLPNRQESQQSEEKSEIMGRWNKTFVFDEGCASSVHPPPNQPGGGFISSYSAITKVERWVIVCHFPMASRLRYTRSRINAARLPSHRTHKKKKKTRDVNGTNGASFRVQGGASADAI